MKGRIEDERQDDAAAAVLLFKLQGRNQAGVVVQPQIVLEPHLQECKAQSAGAALDGTLDFHATHISSCY